MLVINFVIAPIHIGKIFIAKGEMRLEFPLPPAPTPARKLH